MQKPGDEAETQAPAESPGTADEDPYAAAVRKQHAGPSLDYEAQMDVYPLRDEGEDPRWAIRLAAGWVLFAIASIVFILVLIVLGAIYD